MITSTPQKPTATAIQRRRPTFSPRIGTDNAQTHSGIEKKIAAVWASCRYMIAMKLSRVEQTSSRPRKACSRG